MNIKTLFLVCFALTFFNVTIFGQAKDKVAKVVIDAGHGGGMPGAVGKLSKEKHLNLKVALRLGKLISDNFNDVTVIYTRKGDETVDLYKRAEIANKNKADLFISIHCNAADNKEATGVEVFVMGLGKSAENMAIAKKENADMLLEKDQTNYADFDLSSSEAFIALSLYNTAYRNSSITFASKVQKHLVNNSKMLDRTVQEAGFFVLYKVAMPSILIELGFMSNAEEEKYLVREDAQELMAVSIYNAFVEYKNLMEETNKPYLPVPKASKPEVRPKITEVPIVINDSDDLKDLKASNEEIATDSAITATAIDTVQMKASTNEIRFRIQFFTSKENLNTSDRRFNALQEVKKINENGVWKYTSGNFTTLTEAQSALQEVKKKHSDAFIVAFHNERKISVQEAQSLMQ